MRPAPYPSRNPDEDFQCHCRARRLRLSDPRRPAEGERPRDARPARLLRSADHQGHALRRRARRRRPHVRLRARTQRAGELAQPHAVHLPVVAHRRAAHPHGQGTHGPAGADDLSGARPGGRYRIVVQLGGRGGQPLAHHRVRRTHDVEGRGPLRPSRAADRQRHAVVPARRRLGHPVRVAALRPVGHLRRPASEGRDRPRPGLHGRRRSHPFQEGPRRQQQDARRLVELRHDLQGRQLGLGILHGRPRPSRIRDLPEREG